MLRNLFVLFLVAVCGSIAAQQTECKVKLPSISVSYTGECKKGLAHGHGIAQGTDRYEGDFFKGLPEGQGKYTWANGTYYDGQWKNGKRDGMGKMVSGDSVVTGFWKADSYQGTKQGPAYMLRIVRNVQRSSVTKSIESGIGVKIRLMMGGSDNTEIEDFSMAYSSGTEYRSAPTYGIQNASLPLDVTLRYRTWNQLHTVQYDVIFEVTIMEQGTWLITLTNM
jgi:hypothetical protein